VARKCGRGRGSWNNPLTPSVADARGRGVSDLSRVLEPTVSGLQTEGSGGPAPEPYGYGRGRRNGQVMVLFGTSSEGMPLPETIPQWAPGTRYDDFWLTVLNGSAASAEEAGFALTWRSWREGDTEATLLREMEAHDGMVLFSPRAEQDPLIKTLAELGVPVVLAAGRHADPRYPCVACDNAGGTAQSVRHLHRLGHTKIGFLGDSFTSFSLRERLRGYEAAMAEAGLQIDPAWVFRGARIDIPGRAEELLRGPNRPSAWACFDDGAAAILMEQAALLGVSVPRDVAVVGFDDVDIALQTIPHLTTVRMPSTDMASLAVNLLACAVHGIPPAVGRWQVELPVTLVIRESCGEAPPLEIPVDAETARPRTVREELEWRTRQLAAMNQEMKELLHAASHDLRSPLITVQGFVTSLRRKYAEVLDARGVHYLERIRESVGHMETLIGSLLTLSRAHNQPLEMKRVSVRAIIQRVVGDLDGAITEKKARVQVRAGGRLPVVMADETALYRVFLNLIGNALKYLGDRAAPLITVYCRSTLEEYEFTVQDNGIGIAPEHHEEIFQPFRRLEAVKTEGVGIGLAIVKRIVLRHGGRIWVDSQRGDGAAFRFTLPRGEAGGTEQ